MISDAFNYQPADVYNQIVRICLNGSGILLIQFLFASSISRLEALNLCKTFSVACTQAFKKFSKFVSPVDDNCTGGTDTVETRYNVHANNV